jgi:adenine-specific DNA-methyltransferase
MEQRNSAVLEKKVKPSEIILPSDLAYLSAQEFTSKLNGEHKKQIGQYFTPPTIAKFMAGLSEIDSEKESISILDPGCGVLVLSSALIEKLSTSEGLKTIHLLTYDIDPSLNDPISRISKYLGEWLANRGIIFLHNHCVRDFVLEYQEYVDIENESFDYIIANPPYFKLPKDDLRSKLGKASGLNQSNIYSLFLLISINLLKEDGKLICITPRSFTSGRYFRSFRNTLLKKMRLISLHLFRSRKINFEDVLQENVILSAKKSRYNEVPYNISITSSSGASEIVKAEPLTILIGDIVNIGSLDKIIQIPINEENICTIRLFKNWKFNLDSLGFKVSTGPVVSFRKDNFLIGNEDNNLNTAPLFWLDNVNKMSLAYPIYKQTKKQYISICDETISNLIPNRNYIFLRRFSSGDDKSRLIAVPYFRENFPHYNLIGVENKLNYIYKTEGDLEVLESLGLSALLNSSIFDQYFRISNGNTQVGASELNLIPFPSWEVIEEIGQGIHVTDDFSQHNIDSIVAQSIYKKQ